MSKKRSRPSSSPKVSPTAGGSGSAQGNGKEVAKRPTIRAFTAGGVRKAQSDLPGFTRSKQKHVSWRGMPGRGDLELPPFDVEDVADLLLESTDFYTVVSQIARDTVGRSWHFEETREGKVALKTQVKRERELAERFFEDAPGGPEGDETLHSVLGPVSMDWDSTGNGYLEVTRDEDGKPDGLYHLQATRTLVRQDKMGVAQLTRTGRDVVWFRSFGTKTDTGLVRDEKQDIDYWPGVRPEDDSEPFNEVFHFRHYHPASYWYGIPPIFPAISAIRGNTFAADRNIKFFHNKALPEIAVVVSGNTEHINDEDMQVFVDSITDHFMTEMQGEHFKPLILQLPIGVEIKIEKMSEAFKDADHINYQRNNRDEILRAYAMMPNRIGIIEAASLGSGTGESQIEIYKNSVVKPRQEIIEKRLTRIIREGFGITTLAFKFDELDSTDELANAQILSIIAASGAILINEYRKAAGPLVQRMGIELPEIDEEWANLPFAVLAPQLALLSLGIDGIEPVNDTEDSAHTRALVSAFGEKQRGALRQAIGDRAYQRMFDRVARNPNGAAGRGPARQGGSAT